MSGPNLTFNFKAEEVVKSGRTTNSNIEAIKELLELAPQIPKLGNEQIVIFLLACNNEIEATKNCIFAYFKLKAASPELFSNRDLDGEELIFTRNVTNMAIMPHKTKENYTVCIASLKDTSYSNFYLESQVKLLYMFLDLVLYENPPSGLVIIINVKGVGLMHITRLKLAIVKKFFEFLQEALPTQLKQIHILEASYVLDKIIMVLKPFMSKELFNMIIIHQANMNMEEFFEKHIPADLMPSDYGGNLPNLEQLSEETQMKAKNLKHFIRATEEQVEIYKEHTSTKGYF